MAALCRDAATSHFLAPISSRPDVVLFCKGFLQCRICWWTERARRGRQNIDILGAKRKPESLKVRPLAGPVCGSHVEFFALTTIVFRQTVPSVSLRCDKIAVQIRNHGSLHRIGFMCSRSNHTDNLFFYQRGCVWVDAGQRRQFLRHDRRRRHH